MSQSTFLSPDAAHHQAQQQQHMLQQGHAHQIHPAHMQQQQQQGQMSSQGYDAFTGHSNGADNFFASDSLWGMGTGAGSGSADEMAAAMNAAVAGGSAPPTAVSSGSPAMNGGRSNSSNGSGSNSNIPAKRRTGSSMGRSPSNQEGGGGNSPLHHLQASGQASHTSSPHHTQTTFFGGGCMAASPTSQHFTHDVNPATTTPGPRGGPAGAAAAAARFAMPDRSDSMQSLGGFDLKMTDPAEQLMLQQQQLQQQQQGTPGSSGGPGTAAGASTSGDASGEGGESAAEKSKSSRFVFKLMRMVSDPESQHLISFNPSGTSVVVTNFDDFAKEVLPKHFKHSNFSSFIRQLNMYGFYKVNKTPRGQRTTNDSQVWEFSHPKFIRGRTDLLEEIRRKALDNDHARVEARDLRFNVSLGQLQVRHHLEEMQWRLDQTMEQNFQLREFGLGMREALSTVLEYLKAANGGQCPVDVRLPHLDPIGMMHSPMPPPSPYGFGPHGGGPPGAWNMLPTQPSPQMQQGGPMQGMPPHLHHHHQQPQPPQHDRPSIFVTEPVAMGGGGGGGGPPGSVASVPPSPQDMNGPFSSMGNLGNVSPFGAGSRRVSGSSDRPPNDLPDYFALAQGASASGGGGGMPNVFDDGGTSEPGSATIRPGFANLPRRSLSNRGLNIQTNIGGGGGGGEGSIPGTAGGPGGSSSSHPQQAMNPGLGVLGAPNFTDGSPFGPGPGLTPQQLQQQQQHFQAAINTPLPPSPAIPGYHPHAQLHQQQQHQQHPHSYPLNGAGNGGMTPASAAAAAAAAAHFQGQGHSFPPTGGVSPSMLSAPSFDGNHHGLGVAGGSGGSAMGTPALSSSPSSSLPSALLDDEDEDGHQATGLVSHTQSDDDDGDDSDASAADTSLDLLSAPTTADTTVSTGSISRRNKKAMRTPLKRTASGHSEAMVMMAAGEGMGMGGLEETPTGQRGRGAAGGMGGAGGMTTPSGVAGKRKSPH